MQSHIDKEKLPQLGYTTGRNSYWLANVARLLDAILTPGQRIAIVDTCLRCEHMARQSRAILASFLGPVFPASRFQHISDLHSKFALGPHHVSKHRPFTACWLRDAAANSCRSRSGRLDASLTLKQHINRPTVTFYTETLAVT